LPASAAAVMSSETEQLFAIVEASSGQPSFYPSSSIQQFEIKSALAVGTAMRVRERTAIFRPIRSCFRSP
jgi:hypothetical protein